MDADYVTQRIGQALRRLRHERTWTLDDLALETGVSKPMLGQIERGETNPTVVTLWKIASGLRVSFASFLQNIEEPQVALVRRGDQPKIVDDDGLYIVRNLTAIRYPHPMDLFDVYLAPGWRHDAEAHGEHIAESVWIKKGNLSLYLGGHSYDLHEGDAISFTADVQHAYGNDGPVPCEFFVTLTYA